MIFHSNFSFSKDSQGHGNHGSSKNLMTSLFDDLISPVKIFNIYLEKRWAMNDLVIFFFSLSRCTKHLLQSWTYHHHHRLLRQTGSRTIFPKRRSNRNPENRRNRRLFKISIWSWGESRIDRRFRSFTLAENSLFRTLLYPAFVVERNRLFFNSELCSRF